MGFLSDKLPLFVVSPILLFMPGVVPVSVVAATSTTSEPAVASVTNMATQLSSLSAAQIYDMLENRDAQLRKSKYLLNQPKCINANVSRNRGITENTYAM